METPTVSLGYVLPHVCKVNRQSSVKRVQVKECDERVQLKKIRHPELR
ncbi:MAG TPA: hypothetical protein VGK22_09760 [Candidatus Angelobacter sp.]|jgi:hypothetical protein